jgi:hypothetical protein
MIHPYISREAIPIHLPSYIVYSIIIYIFAFVNNIKEVE